MRVRLRLDGRRPRFWHAALVERIALGTGDVVEVDRRPGPEDWPSGADLLFRLETLVHRLPGRGPAASLPAERAARWAPPGPAAPDVVIDLCGDVPAADAAAVWRLTFDGAPGEAGLLAGLLAGSPPVAAIADGDRPLASGRVGTEVRGVVLTAFEDGLSRVVTLIGAVLDGVGGPLLPGTRDGHPPRASLGPREVGRRAAKMAAGAVVQRLYHLCYRAPHWRVGWRRCDGRDLVDSRHLGGTAWRDLPDDGLRFYADPFPIAHDGGCVLFVEDYIHARGKAVISAVRFGADGPLGTPVPVLEEDHHLSYPFVFARDGAHWMVPESCANGTVDLYRATDFPGRWVKHSTLVSGIAASDATLFERDGVWWMFATVRHAEAAAPLGHGCYSDALHLWSAPDFRGPWRPHARNPVLVDIASARPAGRVVDRAGKLVRPVQDCSGGYGKALALARIDRLDGEGYAQTVETTLGSGVDWPGTRLHTWNEAAGFEFIDGSARSPRLGDRRR